MNFRTKEVHRLAPVSTFARKAAFWLGLAHVAFVGTGLLTETARMFWCVEGAFIALFVIMIFRLNLVNAKLERKLIDAR